MMMQKGQETRSQILEVALAQASQLGLEGLSIGTLARDVGMSKSGLFAHFGSKEDLQIAVLDEAREVFTERVVRPALRQPRGLPRVRALFEGWLDWVAASELPGGCVFVSTAMEFDDRPGPVRDAAARNIRDMRETIARAVRLAIAEGHFRQDVDIDQFTYEVQADLVGYQLHARLLGSPRAREHALHAFERIVGDARLR